MGPSPFGHQLDHRTKTRRSRYDRVFLLSPRRESGIISAMTTQIYTLMRGPKLEKDPATLAAIPETDRFGRAIFRTDYPTAEPIDTDLIGQTLAATVTAVRDAVRKSGATISEITLKLAIDAKVGVVFIGNTGVEASIEVKFDCKQ
jgi:hypothetical protein